MNHIPLRRDRGVWLHDWASGADWIGWQEVYIEDAYHIAQIPILGDQEVVIDAGASTGPFTKKIYERNPKARIIAVEVNPENLPVLAANCAEYAEIVQAALTYETGPLELANAVFPNCRNTGGSVVCTPANAAARVRAASGDYYHDRRPIERVTIEQLAQRYLLPRIDLLKLDIEGSEISVLQHADLAAVQMIVGEWHGRDQFMQVYRQRLRETWSLHIINDGHFGTFWLRRRKNRPVGAYQHTTSNRR